MKIIFFVRRFYPHIGGVEKHVLQLSKTLIKKNHSIIVITEQIGNDELIATNKNPFKYEGISIYTIPTGKDNKFKKFRIWNSLWGIRHIINKADIIHCHDVFFWYLPFRFIYPHKPIYTTFHGYEQYPIQWNAIIVRKISELLSWGNICIGDFISKWYFTKPTYVSYGAVDLNEITAKTKTVIKNRYSALFFGRLDQQTGILDYINAYKHVKKHKKTFKMLIVGEGIYKNKIPKDISYVGFQNSPERYFSTYNFAFISRYLSILEAFAAKRLVFALYDNPLKEDYLKLAPYANYMIIEKDPKVLAEKVLYYLEHPSEEKILVDKAHQWVKKQSWEQMASLYLKLWERNI